MYSSGKNTSFFTQMNSRYFNAQAIARELTISRVIWGEKQRPFNVFNTVTAISLGHHWSIELIKISGMEAKKYS